jgi:hypothetical protein
MSRLRAYEIAEFGQFPGGGSIHPASSGKAANIRLLADHLFRLSINRYSFIDVD